MNRALKKEFTIWRFAWRRVTRVRENLLYYFLLRRSRWICDRVRSFLTKKVNANTDFRDFLNYKWLKMFKKCHFRTFSSLLFCLKIQYLLHFTVNFSIYAFDNFHQIESITKLKWFITSSLLYEFFITDV